MLILLIVSLVIFSFSRSNYILLLFQFGYKMLVDYSETQDEMDKLAFTLDRNKFTRSSSFTAGQNTEPAEIKPQVGTMFMYMYCL